MVVQNFHLGFFHINMKKKNNNSTKALHKQKLRKLRLKRLEQRLKSNIVKRKKNILKGRDG